MKNSVKKLCASMLAALLIGVLAVVFVACDGAGNNATSWDYPGSTIGGNQEGSADVDTDTDSITQSTESIIASIADTDAQTNASYDPATATAVTLSGSGTTKISVVADTTYVVSGTLEGQLVFVNGGSEDYTVHIILNNASITSSTSAPLCIFSGLDAVITLAPNSTNALTDSAEHTVFYTKKGKAATTADDDKVNGCLYVQDDLSINGTGELIVNANFDNGISSKGSLKILSGNVSVTDTADGAGIKGKDSVVIKGGEITVNAQIGDGIKTDYEPATADEAVDSVGFVYIDNATVTVTAKDNGIAADTLLQIDGGTVNVTTNGGAPTSITESSSDNADGKGLKVGAIECEDGTEITTVSFYKLIVNGGTITVNSNDDALHSSGYLFINGGNLTVSSGDDGIHAEEYLKISDGSVNVSKCYEGIEAAQITISGGTVDVVSTDDGINAANGDYATDYAFKLIVSGGTINVNAKGDGVDSNGTITISGGTLYIDGPTDNANGSLDSEQGVFVSGGTLVAVGSNGMVETPASNSTQCAICYGCQSSIAAGSTIELKSSDGATIISFTTAKTCQSVVMSAAGITSGNTYALYINGSQVQSVTVNSTITTIGTSTAGGAAPSPGGNWGMGRR